VKAYEVAVERGDRLGEDARPSDAPAPVPDAARAAGREPGPYVAETFSVSVEEDYVVVDV
jgi:hypothetical protein